MIAKIINADEKKVKIEFEYNIQSSFLNTEESIQEALNEAGKIATEYVLSLNDTDGNPINVGNGRLTSKGKSTKKYQTPYGEVQVSRHVYQNSQGGKTYCPLDESCRIIVGSTPKFAKTVSSKYSEFGGKRVQADLQNNHGRFISHNYAQDISNAVGAILENREKLWTYAPPEEIEDVAFIGIGLDGTCIYISNDGYRETMVGTISFYDVVGNRLSTIYTAAAPEYGKSEFFSRFKREISKYKKLYPRSDIIGIADGAKENWTFLDQFTRTFVLDFYHVSEYVNDAAKAIFQKEERRKSWVEKELHKLKHDDGAQSLLLSELKKHAEKKLGKNKLAKINKAITYFDNHLSMMDYANYRRKMYPIGSGVTESACKTIVKQRLSSSGMKWKKQGAATVLCLRALNYSSGRWNQFWKKIGQYGIS